MGREKSVEERKKERRKGERDKGEMSEERVERAKQGDGVRRWGREETDRATGRRKLRAGLEEQNTDVGSLLRSRKAAYRCWRVEGPKQTGSRTGPESLRYV